MSNRTPKREGIHAANKAVSRPEDTDTQRQHRTARLLRVDELPVGAAMLTQNDDPATDSETKSALKRATDARDRKS